jgi:hypothetical protein
MKTFRQLTEEIANIVGSGAVAGVGVGPDGEPPVSRKRRNRSMLRRKVSPPPTPTSQSLP